MGRLREHQQSYQHAAAEARQRVRDSQGKMFQMTAALSRQMFEDEIRARWTGEPTVLVFLFAQPDSEAMRMLDARGGYFDVRSGDRWDLFFPGYYESSRDAAFERQLGARPVGGDFASNWYFNATEFDKLREHVEQSSEHRWLYSGEADLVLINGWLGEAGEPDIDWVSTVFGELTDHTRGVHTLSLPEAIERISRDLESHAEDSAYGIGQLTSREAAQSDDQFGRDLIANALGGIAAALAAKGLGL